jgi:hypothetical protein
MSTFDEQDGLSAGLVKLWRGYRGIDKWPLVPARVYAKEFVEGPDGGGYYKLMLQYQLPATSEPVVVWLTANPTSLPSDAWVGDEIQLRVHPPPKPEMLVSKTQQDLRAESDLLFSMLLDSVLCSCLEHANSTTTRVRHSEPASPANNSPHAPPRSTQATPLHP